MKKKLGIVIALLLCVVLIFTLVACKKKTTTEEPSTGIAGVTTEQVAQMEASINSYLDEWITNNAQEEITNQRKLLEADLKAQDGFSFTDDKNKPVTPTINVSFSNGTYTITFSWNKDAVKKTFTKQAKKETYTHWAGLRSNTADYELDDGDEAASDVIDEIIVGMISTVNKVTGNAITGKFGADTIVGFEVMDKVYGLRVKGNVDTDVSANNEIGLVVVDVEDNNKELGGLYYKGASTAAESMLYLQYAQTDDEGNLKRESGKIVYSYKKLNYADIFGWVSKVLPQTKAANKGVLDADADGLASFLEGYGVNVGDIITGVVNELAKAYRKDDGSVLIDINLGYVMGQVSSLTREFNITSESVPILKSLGIDLAKMHGLRGHISIAAKVTDDGLTDFELAVNIPECTFYFTGDENGKKLNIPSISFAIYVNDFNFKTVREGKVANVIPEEAATKAAYFSPTNVDLSGDIYINHTEEGKQKALDSTFHFEFMTDINPLEIIANGFSSTAKAALVIKQSDGKTYDAEHASNFLTISYEQAEKILCVSGTALCMDDNGEVVYKYDLYKKVTETVDGKQVEKDVFDLDKIKMWLGYTNWIGLDFDLEKGLYLVYNKPNGNADPTNPKASAEALLKNHLAENLMKYFAEKYKEKQTASNGQVSQDSSFDFTGTFNAFKGLYEEFVESGKIDIDVDNSAAKIEVTPEMINKVTAAINKTFDVTLPTDIKDPEYVNLYFNTTAYKNKLFISVKYGDTTYELTFDNSVAKHFSITFKMTLKSNREYKFVFDAQNGVETESATKWTVTTTFDIKDDTGKVVNHTEVTLSDFHGKWGEDNSTKIKALLPSADEKKGAAEIFPADGTGPATKLVEGIMDLLNKDSVEPAAEKIGEFIIRQIVNNIKINAQQ